MKKTTSKKEYAILLELLYQVRANANMRQIDLAKILDVPQSFVSKVESGERRIDIIELIRICDVYNIDISEFVDNLKKRLDAAQ